jgi:phosphoribosyl 1,2-cyclic phosphate phosphodiesterase
MSLTATILGCGSSAGVPRPALGWGACDPANPRNRRRRCSLLVERIGPNGRTRVLVDMSPDLREQLLDADVDWVDGVLITHEHADHTHGIDDLRSLFVHRRRRVDIHLMSPPPGSFFTASAIAS